MFAASEAFQCGGCGIGPVTRSGCDNLQTHQGQAVGNARVNNACPSCGWFAADIAAWPRWNGEMRG
ncbi:hypothetical protein PF010_g21354 [Phytophthora fragariae]|nr:hypothetical protein PF011_g20956 [Phytophthora fragariae]KAE9083041.1 hypothetical protein PF010_g21354 [Phytophthora fragariae]KAE9092219.1 hypothetical protein PF006_g24749 [Phytophthora fragariae]KAE9279079.1 hypothetical protein PF008_g28459 [Phytophthora fragariae]KAE9287326.1 hypothetical protein PF001_g21033 [Phytophthora fragariae]